MLHNPDSIHERGIKHAFDAAANTYDKVAVLQQEINNRLLECFDLFSIECERVLDLGSGTGYATDKIKKRFRRVKIVETDLSYSMLRQSKSKQSKLFSSQQQVCSTARQLPFKENSFDVVYSNLMLQWCANLDEVFLEINRVLKTGGVFVFSSFGPDTLKELRQAWQAVDSDIHVNTFIDMHDVGDALIRNALGEPVLSAEHMQIRYENIRLLMKELKQIGAQNKNEGRRKTLTGKNRFKKLKSNYESFRIDGMLPATYEIVYGHAWKIDSAKNVQSFSLEEMRQKLKRHNRK